MGCLEFVMGLLENLASQLDGSSEPIAREWRHQIVCKLIDAGVTNPDEIEVAVNKLFDLVTTPRAHQKLKLPDLDAGTLQVRLEGILHGKSALDRLRNFVYLLEDEMRSTNRKESHSLQETRNHP